MTRRHVVIVPIAAAVGAADWPILADARYDAIVLAR